VAFSDEDMLRMVARLVKDGGETGMYEGWSADQDVLRRLKLTGEPLYTEPYDRSASVSDRELRDQLEGVLRVFTDLDRFKNDGEAAIREQQGAGNNVADVTHKERDKYGNQYQAQISGDGFESLLGRTITEMVDRRATAKALALAKQVLTLQAKLAKEDEDRKERERKDEDERKERDLEKEHKEKEAKEAADRERLDKERRDHDAKEAAKCTECGESLKEGEHHDHSAKESATILELRSMLKDMQSQMAQMQASQAPIGSRQFAETVPGGANAPGILQPALSMANQDDVNKVQSLTTQGAALMQKYQADPLQSSQIREELFKATTMYKQGGIPNISHPELAQVAKTLGLPNENKVFGGGLG